MIELNAEYIRSRFDYDPESGLLCWKKANKRWKKEPAGSLHKCNAGKVYTRVTLDFTGVYAHRIIWIWMTGEQPDTIDHIDGDGLNNKWSNLRSVSQSENMKNQRIHKTNPSGIGGISYRKDSGRWRVRVGKDGQVCNVGTFLNFDEAVIARDQAFSQNGYTVNHGKS